MKKALLSLILLLNSIYLFAQSSEERNVTDFIGINLGGPYHVHLKQGDKISLRIEGDTELIKNVVTTVEDEKLKIYPEEPKKNPREKGTVHIYITMKKIQNLAVSGSGEIESEGLITSKELKLAVSGSGVINLNVNAQEISSSISGSGNIKLNGENESSKTSISGSGNYYGKELHAKKVTVAVSGSGNATIYASEEITGAISGSGNLYYTGDAKVVNIHKSGSGSSKKID